MKVFVFIVGFIYCFMCLFFRHPGRKLVVFLGFVFTIHIGWIFYHYTGVMIYDAPIITLLLLGIFSGRRFKWYFRGLSLPAILIMVWILISMVNSVNKGWTLAEFSKIVRAYLAFVAVANTIRSKKDVDALLFSIFAGVLFQSLVGIWQWRIGPANLWFLNENFNRWRATGTFYVPHFLGNYLIMFLPILIRLFIFYRPRKTRHSLYFGIVASLGTLALFVSFARGAWVGFLAAMVFMGLFSFTRSRFRPKVKWAVVVSTIGVFVFVGHYLTTIQSQFGESRKSAVDIRWEQYRVAFRMIQGMPIMGSGLGNYQLVSPNFLTAYERSLPDAQHRTYMVHNSYLYFTAETGIVGGLLLLWGMTALFRTGYQIVQSRSSYFANIAIGILTGHLAIAVTFLSGPDIHLEQFQVQFGITVGLLIALRKVENAYLKRLSQKKRATKLHEPPKI